MYGIYAPPPGPPVMDEPALRQLLHMAKQLDCTTLRCRNAAPGGRFACMRCEVVDYIEARLPVQK